MKKILKILCMTVLGLSQLSACVIVPEIKMSTPLDFSYVPPTLQPMSYAELLCCFDCIV